MNVAYDTMLTINLRYLKTLKAKNVSSAPLFLGTLSMAEIDTTHKIKRKRRTVALVPGSGIPPTGKWYEVWADAVVCMCVFLERMCGTTVSRREATLVVEDRSVRVSKE